MNLKPIIHSFLERHQVFIVKSFGFAGSMFGAYLGQKVGTQAVAVGLIKTDKPSPPVRMQERTLLDTTGRYEMVVMYHNANKAGPHIDVHIGSMSLIYRIKPELNAELAFNREGYLTQKSKILILDHLRGEISKRARVPQNLDHSPEQAIFGWIRSVDGGSEQNGYGSGMTRQVVHQSLVDVFKIGNAVEFYAPKINQYRSMYIYQLSSGSDKKAPILIWGNKANHPPKFEDRLHLKSLNPNSVEDMGTLSEKIDWDTSTAKYDGASAYLVITPKGATAWSPRESKLTGEQIEYTHKLKGFADIKSDQTIVAMAEILYMDDSGSYLKGAKISGILNTNDVLPEDVYPEIRLYRVDKIGKLNTHDTPFWVNRELQKHISDLCPELIKPAELMTPHQAKKAGLEGIVVAPPEKSVVDGFKIKWWRDPSDWRIDKVKLRLGDAGRVAGVVSCTSLDSGRQFNLGATAIGNEYLTKHMMANPDLYEGSVLKVNSRHGHEGRSAKVVGFHDDKGLSPV